MAKRYGLVAVLLSFCLVLCAPAARANWVVNGTLVCGADFSQSNPMTISDGRHGAIVVWMDYRNGNDWDIYGNRIDAEGNVSGTGVPVCVAPDYQQLDGVIPDGTGGAIVVWSDDRNGPRSIYAQRIDGTGVAHWTDNGMRVSTAAGFQDFARIVPDGTGGAIFAWHDTRNGGYDIFAQRIDADGNYVWPSDGVPICTQGSDQYDPDMAADSTGGAIIVWMDYRNSISNIYAQKIDASGDVQWGTDGVPAGLGSDQNYPKVIAAPGGGAYVEWLDYRTGYGDVYAQVIDGSGQEGLGSGGLAVCAGSWQKYSPQLVGDGAGGIILAWRDDRSGNYDEVYAQRMDPGGNAAWSDGGTRVVPSYIADGELHLMADGSGGAIVTAPFYFDENLPNDIYAQKFDHDGNLLWGPKGAPVGIAPGYQENPSLASDGFGGAIVAWEDNRAGNGYSDIYGQRVGASGLWGNPEPKIVSCLDLPGDQGGWVRIKTRASSHDVAGETDTPIAGYNVWRMIPLGPKAVSGSTAKAPAVPRSKLFALLADPATAKGIRVSGSRSVSLGLPEGDWESVSFWYATRDTLYNAAVPTKNDSTEMGTPLEVFIVTAHTSTAGLFVSSQPDTGYSVDNLAPGITAGFAGAETASPHGLALSWTRNGASDIGKYDVYRGDDAFFVPDVSNLVGSTGATMLFDGSWVFAYHYFYKLVAVDRHGNAGPWALLRPEDVKVGTMLQSYAAALSGRFVDITWKVSDAGSDVRFVVLREEAAGGSFEELAAPEISRDALSFSMSDKSCEPGTSYRYRVDVADAAGRRTLFETDAISTPAMPLTLYQNHPNPFNPSTTISYYVPAASAVTLDVYDSSGRLVSKLLDRAMQPKGTHSIEWRGLDSSGRSVSSGVYFYRLTSGKETISKKMVLLR